MMIKIFLTLLFCLRISLAQNAINYGIDRLSDPTVIQSFVGKNLAVLTHAAGKTKNQEHLIDILFKNYSLKKIFAPEHGLRTLEDDWIADGTDEATGLPVISLYKSKTRAPSAKDLVGIDAIVVDLQDVGVRYYTYFSTIAEVMKVCATLKIEVILLDRPNLLGGNIVEGKVLDLNLAGSFTAYHTVPTRHGMTLGELALMVNSEKKLGTVLTVIPITGWNRENLITQSDRPWIAPSPALVNIEQVALYALWGTLENFNLAVGRGKTNELAFTVLGAPWITETESKELATTLNSLEFQGIEFIPYSWTVNRALYNGQFVHGVKIKIPNFYYDIRSDEFTYRISSLLLKMFQGRISLSNSSHYAYGSINMISAMKTEMSWTDYKKIIDQEIQDFLIRRLPYLLY